jgi:hypothetical protein
MKPLIYKPETYTHMHTHTHTCTRTYTYTHTHTHTHAGTHKHTHARTHVSARVATFPYTRQSATQYTSCDICVFAPALELMALMPKPAMAGMVVNMDPTMFAAPSATSSCDALISYLTTATWQHQHGSSSMTITCGHMKHRACR